MSIDLEKINLDKIGFCRFKKFGRKYLLTNDIGEYIFLRRKLRQKDRTLQENGI